MAERTSTTGYITLDNVPLIVACPQCKRMMWNGSSACAYCRSRATDYSDAINPRPSDVLKREKNK